MGSVQYIDYNARPILYLDFEGAASDHDVIELAEKARMLVKLGARNKTFVMYNLTGVSFTKRIIMSLNQLMTFAHLVERRVVFGVAPQYQPLVVKMVSLMRLERNTLYCQGYTDAVNTLTDDKKWAQERRKINLPVAEEHRRPPRVYTEDDFLDLGTGEGRLVALPEFDFKLED